jgi:4-diphosphocytidyl-2-C-methyl-D-erythritol kinase
VRVRAFAKINLSLRIVGTRRDGYHDLETTFQSIALHDTLTIRQRRGPLLLTCTDPRVPLDGTNLIVRAARAVWKASGRRGTPHNAAIHLVKRIPMAAGLGGGSADTAAALRAFGALWRVDEERLRTLAPRLGADVAYFFVGGTVRGAGRGEVLTLLPDRPRAAVVIAVPQFGVSTADAYAWWDADRAPRGSKGDLTNDLQRPVAKRHPEIARLVSVLRRAGASQAAMSGSGSAVFGLFDRRAAALRAARALSVRAIVTRTLTRAACRRLGAFF